jgi:hypothetical protein
MISITFVHSLISAVSIFLAYALVVTCAGFFSAWVALKCGDETPAAMGHLSWHPLAHIDIVGAICFLSLGLGWGRMIFFDYRNLSRPWGVIFTYLAAVPVYIFLAISSLVTTILIFGMEFVAVPPSATLDKAHALDFYFTHFPMYSSFKISCGFILLSIVYISVLLAALDIISRTFQAVLILAYPELADRMHYDVRLFLIPFFLMILFINPVFNAVRYIIITLGSLIIALLG